jgi:FkbM family methyltransferase
MPSLHSLVRSLDGRATRKLIAGAANRVLAMRGDPRRFSIDDAGRWVNRQPGATFVSPDIFTGFRDQVAARVKDRWCLAYTPGQGDVVVDLGAGFGDEAFIFSNLVGPSGRVVAIEAHPTTFACLEETVRRSGAGNVDCIQCAVSDRDGFLNISDSAEHVGNSVLVDGAAVPVPARSLDSLSDEIKIDRIDLFKVNIEGAERDMVKGMERIASRIRNIVIECHDFVADAGGGDQFRTRAEVTAALEAFGFKVKRRPEGGPHFLRDLIYASREI